MAGWWSIATWARRKAGRSLRSSLLANVLLDDMDKALEARGYSFARYADDCKVYVNSKKSGERVMVYLRKLYTGLKLQIN
jgi:RNA-directed DNA polymerase